MTLFFLTPSNRARLVSAFIFLITFLVTTSSRADDSHCDGPPQCCATAIAPVTPSRAAVAIGAGMIGLSDINEREGTWAADYYLYEAWAPLPNFTPQTEVVSEVERKSVAFDTTEVRDGRYFCAHPTLHGKSKLGGCEL